jgi:uncharacterized phage-associated protein
MNMKNSILANGERYFQEVRVTTFRKEEYQYVHTGIVDEVGDTWTTTELDEANLFQVYNQYRAKHGIPFPDEIIGLRQHYGLSAAKMAQILGFGINQYRMYEDGEVPSISNARTIIAAREKSTFMNFVCASKSEMSSTEYQRVLSKVSAVEGDYKIIGTPTDKTGYRSLSIDKITAVVKLLITTMGATFVTKMNKLLFYVDFLNYKAHGYGVTGLTYKALKFGPVPQSWAQIYSSLSGVDMEEFVYPGGQSGVLLECDTNIDKSILTEQEIASVDRVCNLFATMSASEISAVSHQEKAWINNHKNHAEISYQEAFSLRE